MLKSIIDRPITVTMAMLIAVVLGIVSLRLLPVSLIPDVDIPYITVQVSDASLSAREMDERVVKPLRQQLIQINSLEELVTESRDGSGVLRLSFGYGADIDYLFIEANEKIDRAMSYLQGIDRPKVLKASATDIPAFFIDITMNPAGGGSGSFTELSRFSQEVISKRIEQLPEVAMVDLSGLVDEEILVLPDERKLSQLGMTSAEFESAILAANIQLGSLTIRDGEYQYNVKFDSKVGSAEEIGAIWFRSGDRLLQIKDIADVSVVPAKRTGLVRSNGKQAVTLAVIKQSDARMADLKDHIQELMVRFEKDYPELEFNLTRDQTQLLEYSIHNLLWNIILGILLACLVIFLFMQDFRSSALVSLTMPIALVFSLFIFYLAGISLNIVSLSGLLLGVGMIADNTIILIDNITGRWQREGNLREAVIQGTKEVIGPMLSAILTTCAVFIPLIFISGIAGALFFDEAMAVTIVLLTSYVVTVTVIPVYYWWWYKGQPSFMAGKKRGLFALDTHLQKWDDKRMEWWMDHREIAWALVLVSFIGAVVCFLGMRKERLPELTETEAILCIDWNDRFSVAENEVRVAEIERLIGQDALQVSSLVGAQQFVLGHSGEQGITESRVYFQCRDMSTLAALEKRIGSYLATAASGASWHFEPAANVFDMVFADTDAPLVARLRPIRNPDVRLETLRPVVRGIAEALPEVTIQEIETQADVCFTADEQRMALYGVSYEDLISALRNALNENRLFSIVQGSRSLPVVTGSDREGLAKVLSETFIEKNGIRIPAFDLMRQSFVEDLKVITSGPEGNYYPVNLQVDSKVGKTVMATVNKVVHESMDYEVSFSGSWFRNREMTREMLLILLIAVALLYLILASQFESLLQPVIILLEILVDIFGVLFVLWLFGISINIMSLIGLVVVTGIVINDSILKIDTINRLRKEGFTLREAVMTASSRRMKAILMTSLTTILAIVPFLFRGSMGADLQFPMSVVIIVGMIFGTLVSLFLIPALYYSIYDRKGRS